MSIQIPPHQNERFGNPFPVDGSNATQPFCTNNVDPFASWLQSYSIPEFTPNASRIEFVDKSEWVSKEVSVTCRFILLIRF